MELSDIKGVGNSIEAKLEQAGITSVNELANQSLEDLTDAGISEGRGENILKRAKKQGVVVKSGKDVEEEQNNKTHVSTGMQAFDSLLGGGLEPGFIIGVSGEHKAGKTQFVFQSLVSAAELTGKPAVYIETEPERFQAGRIKEMCRKDDTYENIYKIEAHDSLEQQKIAYEAVQDNFEEVSLVAIDSFVANFRLSDEFEGRGDLKKRSNLIAKHLRSIQSLATDMECPVLMTLQVYGNPNQYDSSVPIWGGALMHHTITCLIHMSHAKGQLREAQLKGHPGEGDGDVTVKITDSGMEAME